ncbi:hypothetical protein E2C01_036054 [Portunus trituberculatus]|uniref:Ig-like domain-containing protein n=1 Tax=Portunus trituberculatus TaxID=210409 RepID=A0A5B7F5U7_PORTR|nr:hypothetical protein [Portunus trituberculatus]
MYCRSLHNITQYNALLLFPPAEDVAEPQWIPTGGGGGGGGGGGAKVEAEMGGPTAAGRRETASASGGGGGGGAPTGGNIMMTHEEAMKEVLAEVRQGQVMLQGLPGYVPGHNVVPGNGQMPGSIPGRLQGPLPGQIPGGLQGVLPEQLQDHIQGQATGEPNLDLSHILPELNLENNTVTEINANVGDVAHLPCRFPQLSTLHQAFLLLQVSWIRRTDFHILTTGVYTYTTDMRFSVLHPEGTDDWTLQIKYAEERDNGTYECQSASTCLTVSGAGAVRGCAGRLNGFWTQALNRDWVEREMASDVNSKIC